MKKKILVGLLAIVMCFALVGCGNDVVPNDNENNRGNEQQNDNDPENVINLYSDDNKIVFNYMDSYYMTYYHEGDTITGVKYVYQYDDAKTVLEYYFDQCKSVSSDGIYEVVTNFET